MANEQQTNELVALENIYTKEEFSYDEVNGQTHCTLNIFVKVPDGYQLIYKDNTNPQDPVQHVPIAHLPPLTLLVTLPHDYPTKSPPSFTIYSNWLRYNDLYKICRRLDRLWRENEGLEILFTWGEFLQNDILEFLKKEASLDVSFAYTWYKKTSEGAHQVPQLCNSQPNYQNCSTNSDSTTQPRLRKCSPQWYELQKKSAKRKLKKKTVQLNRKRVVSDLSPSQNIVQTLLDFNEDRMCIEFKKNFFTCKICFCDKSGESCTQFKPCMHVFCKECIRGYIEVRVKDGAVQQISCPEENCESETSPGQIKDLVSPELFNKYDSILLNATLDTMLDIIYCPRRHCQYPVSKENNEKMAHCPACGYVFCIYCKMVYHGIEPCKISNGDKLKLINDYQGASDTRKTQLEALYGKKQLQILVENIMSENWINLNSHNCPHCNAAIEKSDGCNKMTCGRCNSYFCWICGSRLDSKKPYVHYQNPLSKCYGMLYYGVFFFDEEEEEEFEDFGAFLEIDSDEDDDEDFMLDPDMV